MPKRNGQEPVPSTIERSSAKAQRTWRKAYESALDEYGEGGRARRVAFAALKHSFEKVGDHWEPKDEKGPSESEPARRGSKSRNTHGGVDVTASTTHLREIAKELDIRGRTTMSRGQLIEAIERANRRKTAQARRS